MLKIYTSHSQASGGKLVVSSTTWSVPKLHGLGHTPGANAAQLAQGNGHEELAGAPSYKNEVDLRGEVFLW